MLGFGPVGSTPISASADELQAQQAAVAVPSPTATRDPEERIMSVLGNGSIGDDAIGDASIGGDTDGTLRLTGGDADLKIVTPDNDQTPRQVPLSPAFGGGSDGGSFDPTAFQGDAFDVADIQGDVEDSAVLDSLRSQAAILQSVVIALQSMPPKPRPIGIGHNEAPDDPASPEDLKLIADTAAMVQQAAPVAQLLRLKENARAIQRIREKALEYLDKGALKAIEAFGAEAGKQLARAPLWAALIYAIQQFTSGLTEWISRLPI